MTRHSKHSCSNSGKFSNHERQLLKYGTTTERLGKDSLKNFDACTLCLDDVVMPVVCNKGHIFCKECILTSLIEQKKEIKRKEKEWSQQNKLKQEEELRNEEQQHQNSIKEFEKNVITLEGIDRDNNKTTTTTTNNNYNNNNNNNNNNNTTIVKEKEIKLNSYWIPGVSSTNNENIEKSIEKPRSYTICPADGYNPLKSAQLINVHFKEIKQTDDTKDSNDSNNRYCCPICEKAFSNSTKLRLLKRCGHVFCSCLDQFSNSNGSSSGKSKLNDSDIKNCYVCEKPYSVDDIIIIQSGGTGFSLNNKLVASTYTTSAII